MITITKIGAREIGRAFGITVTEPRVPFSDEVIERFSSLGFDLVLQTGSPMTMQRINMSCVERRGSRIIDEPNWLLDDRFYHYEVSRYGWRLVSRECLPGSFGIGYVEQTAVMVDYLDQAFGGLNRAPSFIRNACQEFEQHKAELEKLGAGEWRESVQRLLGLNLTSLRESAVEAMYHVALRQTLGLSPVLDGTCSWTRSVTNEVRIVGFGRLGQSVWSAGFTDPINKPGKYGCRISLGARELM